MDDALGADEAAIQKQIQDYSNDSKMYTCSELSA